MNQWERFRRDQEWKNSPATQAVYEKAYEEAYRQAYNEATARHQKNGEAARAAAADSAVQAARSAREIAGSPTTLPQPAQPTAWDALANGRRLAPQQRRKAEKHGIGKRMGEFAAAKLRTVRGGPGGDRRAAGGANGRRLVGKPAGANRL